MDSSLSQPPHRGRALLEVVAFGAAVALVAAASQVAWQLGWALLGHRVVFAPRDVPWMAPLAWLLFTSIFALPLGLAAATIPRRWVIGVGVGSVAGLAVLVFMLREDAIAAWAGAAVAAGVGVRLGSFVSSRPGPARRVAWLASAVAATALAVMTIGMLRWSPSSPPTQGAPATGARPNIVLVVQDVARAASFSAYGFGQQTSPNLERLASEGLIAERAWATAPWTLPSHATIFTGQYPPGVGVDFLRALPDSVRTLAEVLASHGYVSGGFTANEVYTGWDARLSRGFGTWKDYQRTPLQVVLSGLPWQVGKFHDALVAKGVRKRLGALRYGSWRTPVALFFDLKPGQVVVDDFLDWQASIPEGRPFLAFLNMFDAHTPRNAPPEYLEKMTDSLNGRRRYLGALAFMDGQVQRVVDTLRARGVLDRTIFVVVGDHGELFGEHGVIGHATAAYRDLLWVPLVIRYPERITPGTRIAGNVSLRDLPATLLDLAGIEPGALPGHSLLDPAGARRSPAFAYAHQGLNVATGLPNATGPVWSLTVDSVQYIRHPDGAEMLFRLDDATEAHNLAAEPAYAEHLTRVRHQADSLAQKGVR